MKYSGTRAAVALVATLLIVACGGDSDEGTGAAAIPEDQLDNELVNAMCDGLGTCCQNRGYGFNDTACRDYFSAVFSSGSGYSPSSGDGVVYNPQAAGDCLQQIRTALATCEGMDMQQSAACDAMYRGTKPQGAVCESTMECADPPNGVVLCEPDYDPYVDPTYATTCAVYPRGTSGAPCAYTCERHNDCYLTVGSGPPPTTPPDPNAPRAACLIEDGLRCSNGVCEPLAPLGAECDDPEGCAGDTVCNFVTGRCTAIVPLGGACAAGDVCVEDAYCAASATCEPQKPPGAPCEDWNECQGECENNVCVGGSMPDPQVCAGQYG